MQRSRFPSSTSLALVTGVTGIWALCGLAAGCGGSDETCGPGGASASGLAVSGSATALTFGALTSSVNNDCRTSDAPAGVVSVTIFGTQTGGPGRLTLCIARPDLLAHQGQPLVPEVPGQGGVHVVNLTATAAGCDFAIDVSKPITGTATSKGLCSNGTDPAGFALALDGALTLTRTCGAAQDTLSVALAGQVAVVPAD